MFMYNRVGPDIHQMVAVLSTRVKEPNDTCCQNLVVMINYLNETKKNYLALSSDYLKIIKWYVDTSFAVHPYFKIHTESIVTMLVGAMQSVFRT